MITKCDECKKRTNTNNFCICKYCVLNDRCKKAIEHCRERDECPIHSYTDWAGRFVPMIKEVE